MGIIALTIGIVWLLTCIFEFITYIDWQVTQGRIILATCVCNAIVFFIWLAHGIELITTTVDTSILRK